MTILVLLAAAWQLYGAWLGNDLVLPDFAKTAAAFWHGIIDGPLLLRAWTSIRVLFLGYPCNPTGAVLEEAALRELADIAVRHDLAVVSDEIYDRLVYGGHRHRAFPDG